MSKKSRKGKSHSQKGSKKYRWVQFLKWFIGGSGAIVPIVVAFIVRTPPADLHIDKAIPVESKPTLLEPKLLDSRREPALDKKYNPQKIEIEVVSSSELTSDVLSMYGGKTKSFNNEFPTIAWQSFVALIPSNKNRIIYHFDISKYIKYKYTEFPFGHYTFQFGLNDSEKGRKETSFSHAYFEKFTNATNAIHGLDNKGFQSMPDGTPGLYIVNETKTGKYITGELTKKFDFHSNFFILGYFRVEDGVSKDPLGFSIKILDSFGEKLTIWMPDGRSRNSISIVTQNETYPYTLPRKERIARTTNNHLYNLFKIHIKKDDDQLWCYLYLTDNNTIPAIVPKIPIMSQIIENTIISDELITIQMRVQKNGKVIMPYLFIAEEYDLDT